jgi:hypothetical protein
MRPQPQNPGTVIRCGRSPRSRLTVSLSSQKCFVAAATMVPTFFAPGLLFVSCASRTSIIWEPTASRRRPAFSSHLFSIVTCSNWAFIFLNFSRVCRLLVLECFHQGSCFLSLLLLICRGLFYWLQVDCHLIDLPREFERNIISKVNGCAGVFAYIEGPSSSA